MIEKLYCGREVDVRSLREFSISISHRIRWALPILVAAGALAASALPKYLSYLPRTWALSLSHKVYGTMALSAVNCLIAASAAYIIGAGLASLVS
jgi:hypothetical protein